MIEGLLGIGDDFAALERLVSEIEALGSKGLAMAVDVTDVGQIQACVEKTCETFGGVDILFNNAGTAVGVGSFMDIPSENWDLSWQVNVKGMVEFLQGCDSEDDRAWRRIDHQQRLHGRPRRRAGYGAYVVTKFGVVGLTKLIAAEFGPRTSAATPPARARS